MKLHKNVVNPRVSHPPVTIDMGGFFTTQSWIQMVAFFLPWSAMPQGFHWQVVPADLHGHWVLEVIGVASFFGGFHGGIPIPKLAGCLISWENPTEMDDDWGYPY